MKLMSSFQSPVHLVTDVNIFPKLPFPLLVSRSLYFHLVQKLVLLLCHVSPLKAGRFPGIFTAISPVPRTIPGTSYGLCISLRNEAMA